MILKIRLLMLEHRFAGAAALSAREKDERRVGLDVVDLVAFVIRYVDTVILRILAAHGAKDAC